MLTAAQIERPQTSICFRGYALDKADCADDGSRRPIPKFCCKHSVCAPQSLPAGISFDPKASLSVRVLPDLATLER